MGRILPGLFHLLVAPGSPWCFWACSCITPVSACLHMAFLVCLSMSFLLEGHQSWNLVPTVTPCGLHPNILNELHVQRPCFQIRPHSEDLGGWGAGRRRHHSPHCPGERLPHERVLGILSKLLHRMGGRCEVSLPTTNSWQSPMLPTSCSVSPGFRRQGMRRQGLPLPMPAAVRRF